MHNSGSRLKNSAKGSAGWRRDLAQVWKAGVAVMVVTAVSDYLQNPQKTAPIVEHNYRLGQQHFSYQTLERLLTQILPPTE